MCRDKCIGSCFSLPRVCTYKCLKTKNSQIQRVKTTFLQKEKRVFKRNTGEHCD